MDGIHEIRNQPPGRKDPDGAHRVAPTMSTIEFTRPRDTVFRIRRMGGMPGSPRACEEDLSA